MGNFIVISIFAKMSDPEQTFVEANKTVVSRHFSTRSPNRLLYLLNFNFNLKTLVIKCKVCKWTKNCAHISWYTSLEAVLM